MIVRATDWCLGCSFCVSHSCFATQRMFVFGIQCCVDMQLPFLPFFFVFLFRNCNNLMVNKSSSITHALYVSSGILMKHNPSIWQLKMPNDIRKKIFLNNQIIAQYNCCQIQDMHTSCIHTYPYITALLLTEATRKNHIYTIEWCYVQ